MNLHCIALYFNREYSQKNTHINACIVALQEVAEVASFQRQATEAMQTSREKEMMSLRQQLLDIQSQSDEKTVIGEYFLKQYLEFIVNFL